MDKGGIMLKTHYIRAVDEAALYEALEAAGLMTKVYSEFDEEGNGVGEFTWAKADGHDLDIIGVIWKATDQTTTDADGNEVPVMEALDGYHANLRKWDGDFTEEQLAVLPTIADPNNPIRIWG
jgi:hypothetical protein